MLHIENEIYDQIYDNGLSSKILHTIRENLDDISAEFLTNILVDNVNVLTPAGVETKMAEDLRKWGQNMGAMVNPEFISPAYLFLASELARKRYNGRVLEIHVICDFLPVLQKGIGDKDFESKELKTFADESLPKNQLKIFRKNAELIEFMLKYKR